MKYISMIFLFIIGGCSINYLKNAPHYFKPQGTNSESKILQELLQCSENNLNKIITAYVFSKGKEIKIHNDFKLDNIKKAIRNDSLDFIPYWKVEKSQNLVLMMAGLGLWDVIWGYILVNSKTSTIENIVFCHKAETPGLGAEISKREFEEKFIGLKLIGSHSFVIKKPNQEKMLESPYHIEGISGATITSDGLHNMINSTAKHYAPLFKKN